MNLKCIGCNKEYSWQEVRYSCDCGESLEVVQDLEKLKSSVSKRLFDQRLAKNPFGSGVWRYKELILPVIDQKENNKKIVTKNEGNTRLYSSKLIDDFTGNKNTSLKHEGENPTGSFKDRGMTVGITAANFLNSQLLRH